MERRTIKFSTPPWVQRSFHHYPWWILPVTCWTVMVLVVVIRVCLAPTQSTVYPIFDRAGHSFVNGLPLYEAKQDIFRYSPVWAWFFSLGEGLPLAVTSTLWRLAGLLVLVLAAHRFQRDFFPEWSNPQRALWWLLMLPFCLGSFNNAQSNILLVGLLLASLVSFARKRYATCAAFLAISISLKIYPLAWALLLLVLQPMPLLPILLVALSVMAGIPFLFQSTTYIATQYASWSATVFGDLRTDRDLANCNRDGWQLLRLLAPSIEYRYYQVLQAVTALGLAAWARLSPKLPPANGNDRVFLLKLYNVAIIWMLVMGPATESSTYALLAPLTALAVVLAFTTPCSRLSIWMTLMSFSILLLAHLSSAMTYTLTLHKWGVHPIGALLAGATVHRLLNERTTSISASP